jgi:ATP-binding cassette subfamily C protein
MIGKATWDRIDAPSVKLTGNRPVLIDRDTTVRFVESGSVALYSVPVRDGRVAGTRNLLAQSGSGQALFSAGLVKPEGMRFAFVPTGPSVIRLVPLGDLWTEMVEHGIPLGSLVDEWVALVAGCVGRAGRQDVSARASDDGTLSLEAGETLASERGRVLWIGAEEGRLELFGDEGRALEPAPSLFPLVGGLWVRAAEPTRVTIRRSASLGSVEELELGLRTLHELALDTLDDEHRSAMEAEVARLHKRRDEQERRRQNAVHELAAVLDPGARHAASLDGSPLMVAMTEVGASLGVDMRVPGKSEELESSAEPVEAIARASRVRTRRVVLSGDWWTRDGGPLLCVSDDEERRPLALTQDRSGYRIFDPVEGTRRKLDAESAAGLAPEAMAFYRPLPEGPLKLVDFLTFALRGRAGDIKQAVFAGLIVALLGLLVPIAMSLLMDQAIPDANRRLLFAIGVGLFAVTVGRVLFLLLQGLFLLRIHAAWEAATQAALWDRLLSLRSSFFRRHASGDLQSRVMAVDTIGAQLSGATMSSVVTGIMALLNLGLLFYYSSLHVGGQRGDPAQFARAAGGPGPPVRDGDPDHQRRGQAARRRRGHARLQPLDEALRSAAEPLGAQLRAARPRAALQRDRAGAQQPAVVLLRAAGAGAARAGRVERVQPGQLPGVQPGVRHVPHGRHEPDRNRGRHPGRPRQGTPARTDPRGGA